MAVAFLKISPARTETEKLLNLCAWGVFLCTALWAIFFVPITADEANVYHVLACLDHPFARYDTFINGCDHRSDLLTPLGFTLAKPYVYGGVLPSVLYAPFYFLFHSPSAQYWFGLLCFLGFAWLFSRETAKPGLSFPVILAFFPFAFQFIHDLGPVKFAFLAFCLGVILLRKLLASQQPAQTIYAFFLALLIVLATEDKTFFLYLLPSFAFFCLAMVANKDWKQFSGCLKKARPGVLLAVLLSLTGILGLLFATNVDGQYYFRAMIDFVKTTQQSTMPLEARGGDPLKIAQFLFTFLFLWPYYAHRIYDVLGTYYDLWNGNPVVNYVLNALTAVFFVVCIYLGLRTKSFALRPSLRTVFLILSFLSTLLVFFAIRNVWAAHHFVFLGLPLMMLFLDLVCALDEGPLAVTMSLFLFINALSVLTLTHTALLADALGERDAVLDYFADPQISAHSIVNYSSWGLYNIHALYGPKNELVTYTDQLTPKKAKSLLELSQKTGRRIYNVCVDTGWGSKSILFACSKDYLDAIFGGNLQFQERLAGLPTWRVYEGIPH